MRTTLNIDDDVLDAAKHMAYIQAQSLGAVVSDLLRKGMQKPSVEYEKIQDEEMPVFHVSEGAKTLTLDDIKNAEDEE